MGQTVPGAASRGELGMRLFRAVRSLVPVLGVTSLPLIVLVGCYTYTPPEIPKGVRLSDEEVYRAYCGACHKPYAETHFTLEKWERFLPKHPSQKKHRPPEEAAQAISQHLGL